MKTCPGCGTENRDTALFCRRCSRRLPSAQMCPNCGRLNPPDAQFCNGCSYSFSAKAMPAPGQTGLLTPQSLLAGRYRILRRVGQGGMGGEMAPLAMHRHAEARADQAVEVLQLVAGGVAGAHTMAPRA